MAFAAAEKFIRRITQTLALAGGGVLLAAVAVTCISIIGKLCRRLLNSVFGADFNPPLVSWIKPILGEEELVQYAVGFALFAALPWVTLQRGHIVINLLENYFSRTVNKALNLAGSIALAVIAYLLMTRQWFLIFKKARTDAPSLAELLFGGDWTQFTARMRLYEESQILGLKLWQLYMVAEACIILLFIVSIFCVWRCLRDCLIKEH